MFRWSAVFRQTRSSQMTTLPREIFPDVESERPCWLTFQGCYCPTINMTSLTQSFTDKCWQLHKRQNVHSSHLTAVLKTVFPLTPLVWSKNVFAMIYWHTSYCYENTHKSSVPSVCGRRTSFHFLGKCLATMHLRHSLRSSHTRTVCTFWEHSIGCHLSKTGHCYNAPAPIGRRH